MLNIAAHELIIMYSFILDSILVSNVQRATARIVKLKLKKPKNFFLKPQVFTRAGKNLRFFKKRFRVLGFNVRTVARSALDTGIRSRRRPLHED